MKVQLRGLGHSIEEFERPETETVGDFISKWRTRPPPSTGDLILVCRGKILTTAQTWGEMCVDPSKPLIVAWLVKKKASPPSRAPPPPARTLRAMPSASVSSAPQDVFAQAMLAAISHALAEDAEEPPLPPPRPRSPHPADNPEFMAAVHRIAEVTGQPLLRVAEVLQRAHGNVEIATNFLLDLE